MATIDTIAARSTGTALAGKAYFETSTNKFIVFNGSAWIELDSDGTGAVPFQNRWGANFDGSDDYLDLGSNTFINKSNPFSISTWFKLDSWATTYPGICVIKTAGEMGYMIGLSNTAPYSGVWSGSNGTDGFKTFSTGNAALAATITSGWHHLVLTYDGVDPQASSSRTVYIDSTEYGIVAVPAGNSSNNNYIGRAASRTIDGMVDDFAIFNTELDQAAVTALYGASPNAGIPSAVTGAIGYWRMGDDSNDSPVDAGLISGITDSSGNGNDATTVASSQPTFKALDQSTTSLSFDGSDDKLTVSDSSLDISGDLTMSFWFKADAFGTWNYPLILTTFPETIASEHMGRCLGFNGANLSSLTYYDHDSASTTLNTGQWYHAAVVYERTAGTDTGFHTIYLNGSVDLTRTSVSLKDITYVETQIGQSYNANHFDGLLDDVAIFNSALSASDVSSLAASRGAHIVNDLSLSPVAYYRMGEDDSLTDGQTGISQITDASGNGNHALQATAANQPTASIDPVIYV